jgi:hypothetical protein
MMQGSGIPLLQNHAAQIEHAIRCGQNDDTDLQRLARLHWMHAIIDDRALIS